MGTQREFTASSLVRRPLPFLVLAAALLMLFACRQPFDPGFKFVLVSQEIAVGQARFAFVLLDQSEHAIEDARISVDFLPPGDYPAPPTANAVYRKIVLDDVRMSASEWYDADVEVRGIYAVDQPPFDRPGEWELKVYVTHGDSKSPVEIDAVVQVLEESSTPRLGERVSPIEHRTAADVADLTEISTSPNPLPEMYQTSVGEALAEGQPFLVLFATPAFCQSRICGPVVETVASLIPDYGEDIAFIHIEPYDLDLIRGGGKFEPSVQAKAWGLPSEPWVFLVDASGRLTAKFEGIVTFEELDEAIRATLAQG